MVPNIHDARLALVLGGAQDGRRMDWSGLYVSVLAAAGMAAAVGAGAWVVLHWPAAGLRHAIDENPVDVAAFAVGFVLRVAALLFFATVPWSSQP